MQANETLSEHVAGVYRDRGMTALPGEIPLVVSRLAAEGSGPRPPDGLVAAVAQEAKADLPAIMERRAQAERAIVSAGERSLSLVPDTVGLAFFWQANVGFQPLKGLRSLSIPFVLDCGSLPDSLVGHEAIVQALRSDILVRVDQGMVQVGLALEEFSLKVAAARSRLGRDSDLDQGLFLQGLEREIASGIKRPILWSSFGVLFPQILSTSLARAVNRHARFAMGLRFQREAGYSDYVATFTVARSLGRRLTLIVGPTNSGKTHEALMRASAAATARVLSPLRLLALEHYERLVEAGLKAGMVTGEEVLGEPDATHVAQTIETASQSDVVDVVVIDEIQMLHDPARGWAWTEAILGAPGREVVMTGSPDAVEMVRKVAERTGEPLEVIRLERKSPLQTLDAAVPLSGLKKGDGLIVFSRRELFEYRELIVRLGHSVASVYGALSPEVRRAEARRFREGEADILVATDAIGMGLNIGPLQRVVFSTLEKFDGREQRPLNDSEIRQIAGRAGRYGYHGTGYVGVLAGQSMKPVVKALSTRPESLDRDRFLVRPTMHAIRLGQQAFQEKRFVPLLDMVVEQMMQNSDLLEMSDLSDTYAVGHLLDDLGFAPDTMFHYAVAPVDRRTDWAMQWLRRWAVSHDEGSSPNLPADRYANMSEAEGYGRLMTLYLWLSRKFPEVYDRRDDALDRRRRADRYVEAELLASSRVRAETKMRNRGRQAEPKTRTPGRRAPARA